MKLPLLFLGLLTALFLSGCETTSSQRGRLHTPEKGTPERKAIVDAVKASLARQGMKNVVVAVPYLKVHNGWAWIQVHPKTADGTQNYEFQSGLLHEKAKAWTVLEWMPAEEGTDTNAYFKKVKAKYPAAPVDIFPQ